MKKKKSLFIEGGDLKSWIYISIIILFAVIMFLILFFGKESTYHIYKNECHNETTRGIIKCFGNEGFEIVDKGITGKFNFWANKEAVKYCIEHNQTEWVVNFNSGQQEINIKDLTRKQTSDASAEICAVGNISKEVCNKTEVDEIYLRCINEIGNSIPCDSVPKESYKKDEITINGITKIVKIIQDDETGFKHAYYIGLIKKSDITKEWLNNNCDGCMANQEGKCLYYKCGSYEVII